MSSATKPYDVAIVGAGPAGSASAILLARAGWRVALIDRSTFPRDKPCAEYLSPAAEPLLTELGVMDKLEATRPARLRGFRIYSPNGGMIQGDFAATRDAQGRSLFETGLAIPRLRLDATLVEAARTAGAEIHMNWRLAQLAREDGVWKLTSVGEGEPISARLLLAADGVHSTVARRLGLHETSRMRKVALVAHMRGIAGMGEYGEMHVAGRRYVGIAPLEPPEIGDLCNVAMVVDEARDGRKLAGQPERFLLEALETFPKLRGRLDQATVTRRTLTISRINVRAKRLSDEGLLLVGDATGYYDPFTGEGIYRALHGAQLACQVALEALAKEDLSAATLARYDRLYRETFKGKRLVEMIIQSAVQAPPLMDHLAHILGHRKEMADTVIAVTGDFLPPSAVLRPGYLLRLVL
ncbi:MAG TPA: NAD(P)/FAD-dependent oxidoreductase [Ktedonobacterales bacterium]|jgi:flavin-dependent dehydrogenase